MTVKDWLEKDKRVLNVTQVQNGWRMELVPGYAFGDSGNRVGVGPTLGKLVQARKTITATGAPVVSKPVPERRAIVEEPEPEPAPPVHTMEDRINRYAVFFEDEHIPTSVAAYSLEDLKRRLKGAGRHDIVKVCIRWQDITEQFKEEA